MKLIHKILLGFLSGLLMFWIIGYITIIIIKKDLKEVVTRDSEILVDETLDKIYIYLHSSYELLREHSKESELQKAVLKSNQDFEKLDNIQAYINKIDHEWISATKEEGTP